MAIAMSVVLSVMTFVPRAHAQPPQRFRADSGVVTPAVGQTLRVTVASARQNDIGMHTQFRWMQYGVQSCSGAPPVCRHMVVSQGATTPMVIDPNETLTFDVQGTGAGVRVVVETNSPGAIVRVIVFDTSTGRSDAIWDAPIN